MPGFGNIGAHLERVGQSGRSVTWMVKEETQPVLAGMLPWALTIALDE